MRELSIGDQWHHFPSVWLAFARPVPGWETAFFFWPLTDCHLWPDVGHNGHAPPNSKRVRASVCLVQFGGGGHSRLADCSSSLPPPSPPPPPLSAHTYIGIVCRASNGPTMQRYARNFSSTSSCPLSSSDLIRCPSVSSLPLCLTGCV